MRILVTGGTGFIGSHVVERVIRSGRQVRILDNMSSGRLSNLAGLAGEVELSDADIRDLAAVNDAMCDCDAVVHLAGVPSAPQAPDDPSTTHNVNATGTLNVLLAAREVGVSRVVFASSAGVYGTAAELPTSESTRPSPVSHSAASKLAAEGYCRTFFEAYGLETVTLRYFNVFGPRQESHSDFALVIPRFIRAFRNGEPPVIDGDGEQSRDFVYVDDVVEATIAALQTGGIGGQIYNVGSGNLTTLNDLADAVRTEVGAAARPTHGPARPNDIRQSLADVSQARRQLGYEPAVSLKDGLRRTVQSANAEDSSTRPHALRSVKRAPARGTGVARKPRQTYAWRRSADRGRYLITGGAGFIGSHMVEALASQGRARQIVVLDDLSTGRLENLAGPLALGDVEFVEGSAANADVVDDLMQRADVCVHLASAVGVQLIVNDPLDTLMRSVRASNVVMHAASRHDVRVLFSSTSEVYGKQTGQALTEQDDLILGSPSKGRWTYAIAKSFGEALIHGYHNRRGVEAAVVRLFNTVGPRQTGMYGMVLPRFVRQALDGTDLTVYGNGAQTRCFTHVADTVSALLLLCENEDAHGKTFNVGSSTPVSILELARRVIERTESDSGIVLVPYEEAYEDGFEELGIRRPDTTALRQLTGWQPWRSVDDAIDDVIEHERRTQQAGVATRGATADVA